MLQPCNPSCQFLEPPDLAARNTCLCLPQDQHLVLVLAAPAVDIDLQIPPFFISRQIAAKEPAFNFNSQIPL